MDLQIQGKRILVTGSSAGIGLAIAKEVAKEGAEVIITGRSSEKLDKAKKEIQEQTPNAKVITASLDFSKVDEINQFLKDYPEVDVLINNVGIFEPKPFEKIEDADWFRFYEINVMSGVRLARYYFPKMLEKNAGKILFISSESGIHIPDEMIHYGMTKSAQLSIARGLAELTKGTKVTVNSVLPGPTRSEGVEEFVKKIAKDEGKSVEEVEEDFFNDARPSSLIQRFIEVEEVAAMVAFLCSPRSSATNGAPIRVDGGVVKSMA